ncbi:MAG: site-2 protease family protein [Candidatus Limnocylindrales bacterium]
MDQDTVQALFSAFIVVATMLLVGFPVHEFMHAWTAMKLGDNTARWMGRVSLDPRVHFDQMGGLILTVTAVFSAVGGGLLFGWAKPTPVNPINLRYGRQGHALVAFAGPASNLVTAALVALVIRAVIWADPDISPILELFWTALWLLLWLNIVLFIFNLIPIPPLDGWSVLKGVLPASTARRMTQLEIQYASVLPMVFFGFIVILFVAGGDILLPIIDGVARLLVGV